MRPVPDPVVMPLDRRSVGLCRNGAPGASARRGRSVLRRAHARQQASEHAHPCGEHGRAGRTAVRRRPRFRACREGPPRGARTPRDPGGRHRPRVLGHDTLRLRRRGRARHGEPEPLASGEAQQHPRTLRGRRRDLPGQGLRPLERVLPARRDGLDRGRSAHLRGSGARGARARERDARRAPRGGRDLHPQPRRSLRGRARRRIARGRRRGEGAGARAGGFQPPRGERERDGRQRHDPPGGLHVRATDRARSAGTRGRRPRQDHVLRSRLDDPADGHHR